MKMTKIKPKKGQFIMIWECDNKMWSATIIKEDGLGKQKHKPNLN